MEPGDGFPRSMLCWNWSVHVAFGFVAPGKRASVLVFSRERAAAQRASRHTGRGARAIPYRSYCRHITLIAAVTGNNSFTGPG